MLKPFSKEGRASPISQREKLRRSPLPQSTSWDGHKHLYPKLGKSDSVNPTTTFTEAQTDLGNILQRRCLLSRGRLGPRLLGQGEGLLQNPSGAEGTPLWLECSGSLRGAPGRIPH